ncbi:MAG: carbohydrate kinase family protein [Planctomycetes bacterium]|nr:carbohydrate kinase family protein [Planctomycetota bacterium]
MREGRIVVSGHVCLDLSPRFERASGSSLADALQPGSLVMVGECVISTGGAVANTGLALTRFGVDTALMGKVGDDTFGQAVIERLERHGCAGGIRRVSGEHTSYSIVIAPPGIDRAFLHNPGANDTFGADDVDYEAVGRADIFHLGYPPVLRRLRRNDGEELRRIFQRVKELGVTTSLDMSMPDTNAASGRADWRAIFKNVLPHTDLLLPGAEEMLLCLEGDRFARMRREAAERRLSIVDLLQPADFSRLAERLLADGAGIVALKSAHRGIYLRTGSRRRLEGLGRAAPRDLAAWSDRQLWQPACSVDEVVSATGAGDCAVAGFLAAFLRGEPIEQVLKCAAVAGAQNLSAQDAVSGLGSYEEVSEAARKAPDSAIMNYEL